MFIKFVVLEKYMFVLIKRLLKFWPLDHNYILILENVSKILSSPLTLGYMNAKSPCRDLIELMTPAWYSEENVTIIAEEKKFKLVFLRRWHLLFTNEHIRPSVYSICARGNCTSVKVVIVLWTLSRADNSENITVYTLKIFVGK